MPPCDTRVRQGSHARSTAPRATGNSQWLHVSCIQCKRSITKILARPEHVHAHLCFFQNRAESSYLNKEDKIVGDGKLLVDLWLAKLPQKNKNKNSGLHVQERKDI